MSGIRIVAVIVFVIGVLGIAYGGYYWFESSHSASVGPFHLSVGRTRTISVPFWVGVVALVAGGVLWWVGGRRGRP